MATVGEKGLEEKLQAQWPYGNHHLRFITSLNHSSLTDRLRIECKVCGSYVAQNLTFGSDEQEKKLAYQEMIRAFSANFDQDCDTSKAMNLVRGIHDR